MENPKQPFEQGLNVQKPFYKKWWFILVAVLLLPFYFYLLPLALIWYIWVKTEISKVAKIASTAAILILPVILLANVDTSKQEAKISQQEQSQDVSKTENEVANIPTKEVTSIQPEQSAVAQNEQSKQVEQPKEEAKAEMSTKSQIEAIVKGVGDYEVTVWDLKGNPAKDTTPAPYEVYVIAGNGKIASCFYAKNVMFDIMKKLYSNATVKDKIARIMFTSWGHLRTSLGSEDGSKLDWATAGPTNFWDVMMKVKPYEDETGPVNQRTWGVNIGKDCQ